MAKMYFRWNSVTGGGSGDLDGIDGAILSDRDGAIVFNQSDGLTYFYVLDVDSGATESPPDIVKPDINADNKRWILKYSYQEKIRDRNIFIQSSQPTDSESTIGDVWIDIT